METLCICAGDKELGKKSDIIYLGCISDTWVEKQNLEIIKKPLANILEKYPNTRLRFYGYTDIPSGIKEFRSRIEIYEPISDLNARPDILSKVHIHLVPFVDTIFNTCGPETKWLETALVKRPIVASRNVELELIVQNGITGFLCEGPQEWDAALTKLIEDTNLRNQIGKNACEKVLQSHLTRNNGSKVVDLLTEI